MGCEGDDEENKADPIRYRVSVNELRRVLQRRRDLLRSRCPESPVIAAIVEDHDARRLMRMPR